MQDLNSANMEEELNAWDLGSVWNSSTVPLNFKLSNNNDRTVQSSLSHFALGNKPKAITGMRAMDRVTYRIDNIGWGVMKLGLCDVNSSMHDPSHAWYILIDGGVVLSAGKKKLFTYTTCAQPKTKVSHEDSKARNTSVSAPAFNFGNSVPATVS